MKLGLYFKGNNTSLSVISKDRNYILVILSTSVCLILNIVPFPLSFHYTTLRKKMFIGVIHIKNSERIFSIFLNLFCYLKKNMTL